MKAHQSDKDADEGHVERTDLQGNRQADAAAKEKVPENVCLLSLPTSGSTGVLFVRLCGISGLAVAQDQASGPEPEPEIVESAKKLFPAAPFVIGPHQRVVEHETYAFCLDCERYVGVHTGRRSQRQTLCAVEEKEACHVDP
eukprot:2408899-Amphidinium_carterae.1